MTQIRTIDPQARRSYGFILGALLGLVYGLVSQMINRVILPGVPLYQPPLGPAGNMLLTTLLGAILGLLAAWPAGSLQGILASSGFAAALIVLISFVGVPFTERNSAGLITAAAFMLLPLVALTVPLIGVLRWAVNGELEARRDRSPRRARVWRPLALGIAVAAVGALSLIHEDGRQELAAMHALIQAGLAAPSAADLPEPLRDGEEVSGFRAHALGTYTLEWVDRDLNRFRIPRPGRNFDYHAIVLARFANDWRLACLFVTPDEPPVCKTY